MEHQHQETMQTSSEDIIQAEKYKHANSGNTTRRLTKVNKAKDMQGLGRVRAR